MDFFSDHKKLFSSALAFFIFLTLIICIFPALNNQKVYQPLQGSKPLTEQESRGKAIYIREGCVACHTQQVRNVDMDQVFGNRPSLAADYARNKRLNLFQNTATLMGTERTGPDLTNIGARQSSKDWQYSHLYNPRSVVPESVMPSYQWLFLVKEELDPGGDNLPDGEALFIANCATCHQANGEGVPGAFPPLKGDKVVLGDNLELYVTIIMKGYNGLAPQYGEMLAVGTNANFTPEDVAAIINHERTSWGNNGKKVTAEEVKAIMDKIK